MTMKSNQLIREEILRNLQLCSTEQRISFRRIHSPKNIGRDLQEIINAIPRNSLLWIRDQTELMASKNK